MLPDSPDGWTLDLAEGEVSLISRKPGAGDKRRLVLPFPEVSGQHAEIRCTSDGWNLVDNGSTNGTSLNGTRLTPGKEYVLHSGDKVKIAQYELLVSPPLTRPEKWTKTETSKTRLSFAFT